MDTGPKQEKAISGLKEALAKLPNREELEAVAAALEANDPEGALRILRQQVGAHETIVANRQPGRFKGRLIVGQEFFEPLSDDEIRDLIAE